MRGANPYRPQPGGQPPALVGRDLELAAVRLMLRSAREGGPLRPTVFVGLRGMGKTALLRRAVRDAQADGAVAIQIEASGSVPLATALADGIATALRDVSFAARLRDTVDRLRGALPGATFDLPGEMGKIEIDLRGRAAEAPSLRGSLEALNVAARRRGSYVLIAIDEIQEATLDDLREVVMFVHQTAGTDEPAIFVGAGLTNSARHLHEARTYTERWRYPRLDPLSAAATRDALALPAQANGVAFSDDALDLLADETAGYPFFVQEYGSLIWALTDGPAIDADIVRAHFPMIRNELDEQFYAPRFVRLTGRECAYALTLASLGDGVHATRDVADAVNMRTSELSSIRNQLIKKEVLFAQAPGLIEFRMPLTRRYIERHRANLELRAAGSALIIESSLKGTTP